MRIEPVEIYSDASNAAILRHPGRRFPGMLVQGDTLSNLYRLANAACAGAKGTMDEESVFCLTMLRDDLWVRLIFYKNVLEQHGIDLPFDDIPPKT